MDPYEVLGVSNTATHSEIRSSYRNLVKRYHPDANGQGVSTDRIREINAAYDILCDPEKRLQYDNRFRGLFEAEVMEEDPREVYRRELNKRKKQEALDQIEREKSVFRKMRQLNFLLAVLAFSLAIDEYLPPIKSTEAVVREWVEIRTGRRSKYTIRHVRTESFKFSVPTDAVIMHGSNKGKLFEVGVSPIFKIPVQVSTLGEAPVIFEPSRTLYSFMIPFHFIFAAACLVSLLLKNFNHFAFSLSFMPALLCVIMLFYLFAA